MRTYDIPVNADLIDIICPADTLQSAEGFLLFYNIINLLHASLLIEYSYLVSGGMPTHVKGRNPVNLKDFLV